MRRCLVVPAVVVLLACRGEPAPPSSSTEEALPTQPVSREIAADAVHRYRVTLAPEELLDVEVVEDGSDLRLTLLDGKGETLRHVDGPFGGDDRERLIHVAGHETAAVVEVGASGKPGSYELLVRRRKATEEDRRLDAAVAVYVAGEAARRAKDDERAAVLYQEAAGLFREAGEGRWEMLAWYRLGQVERRRERGEAEVMAHLRAEQAARTAGLVTEQALAARRVGWIHSKARLYEAAAVAYERSAELFGRACKRHDEAYVRTELARSYEVSGRLEPARTAFRRALEAWRLAGDVAAQGTGLNNLGGFHLRLGQPRIALDYFLEAEELRRASSDRRGLAITWTSLGKAYRRLGRPDEARDAYRRALGIYLSPDSESRERFRSKLANPLVGLGLVELNQGRFEAAEHALTSAVAAARLTRQSQSEAAALLGLGEVHERRGDAGRAREIAQEALAIFDELADVQGQGSAFFAIARAERIAGNLPMARRWMLLAVERVEAVREGARIDAFQTSYFARKREYYEHLIDLLMELHVREPEGGWAAQALEVSERSRAKSLLETLLVSRRDLPRRLDEALVVRERDLVERLALLQRRRLDGDAAADADREIRRLALELDEVHERLRRAHPGTAELLRPRTLSVEELRAEILGEGDLLLEISLGEAHSHLWLLGRDVLVTRPLAGRQRLEKLARRAHQALRTSHGSIGAEQAREQLAELSRLLLAPVAEHLGERRLLVVAEGALQYVPFAVLPDPRTPDGKEPSPLVERHEVVTLPSASLVPVLRRPRARRAGTKVAVFADPVTSLHDPRLAGLPGLAPPDASCDLPRLHHSAGEAAAILELVPEDERFLASGFDARVDLVRGGALADARIVHFATHATIDAEVPMLSGLALACFDAAGRPREGVLRAHEIYDLELGAADLVVLSACRTALGREVRGEGLLGLVRGFFHAGAPRVVVSLWNVDDQATAELMSRFYRHHLVDGMTPAAALAAAQRSLRREPGWSAPYYWAGFVLEGDWR